MTIHDGGAPATGRKVAMIDMSKSQYAFSESSHIVLLGRADGTSGPLPGTVKDSGCA
jgi:hypothetical protein